MSQNLPLITVWAEGDDGNISNLTETIFAQPNLHNLIQDNDTFNQIANSEFPDRPLASIESLNITVQTPSVGGAAEITMANLKVKIHSPSIVSTEHPKGKYLAFMMIPGYKLRIRWGVTAENIFDQDAFQ